MTIGTTLSTITVDGNGVTTTFTYPFLIPQASDAVVTYTDANSNAAVLLSSQYSITGTGNENGGTVTYPLSGGTPIVSGTFLTIERLLPEIQGTSLSNQGPTFSAIEDALDYLTMLIQQVNDFADRAIVINPADTVLPTPLPIAAVRAGQYLGFDSSGQPIAATPAGVGIPISVAMQPVVEASTTAVAGRLLGMPSVINIAALRAATTATVKSPIFVQGFSTTADGGQGVFEIVSSDTTTADNGGTIIVDASGNRWYRASSGEPWSILWFGGSRDGATDNLAAWNAMASAASAQPDGGSVAFPPGKYSFSGNAAFVFPSGRQYAIQIVGYGATLYWPNAGGGISFEKSLAGHTVALSGMHITTGLAAGGNGVFVTQTDPLLDFFQDSFRDVVWRGDDNNGHTGGSFYWTKALVFNNSSGTAVDVCSFYGGILGTNSFAGNGIVYQGTGVSGTDYSIYHNISKCIMNNCGDGVTYGSFAQGVTMTQTNMQNTMLGFVAPVGAGGALSQLQISDSQFACVSGAIACLTAIGNVMISNNDIFGMPNQAAIFLNGTGGFTITGNTLAGDGSLVGSTGILVANNTTFPSTISGNGINGFLNGVNLDTGSSNTLVSGNSFANCTNPYINAGTGNQIVSNLGLLPVSSAPSIGASPWLYHSGDRPEVLYIAASTSLNSVTQADGSGILPLAAGANVPFTIQLDPNTSVSIAYTGTLHAAGTKQ